MQQTGPNDLRRNLEATADSIGRVLKEAMPLGYGFAVLIFDIGPSGFMAYASNAQRADMVKALRELASNMERDPKPGHR